MNEEANENQLPDHFEWWHSYAKMTRPLIPYDSTGIFGSFATYNVENRDRVKCINAMEGLLC